MMYHDSAADFMDGQLSVIDGQESVDPQRIYLVRAFWMKGQRTFAFLQDCGIDLKATPHIVPKIPDRICPIEVPLNQPSFPVPTVITEFGKPPVRVACLNLESLLDCHGFVYFPEKRDGLPVPHPVVFTGEPEAVEAVAS